MKKLLSFVKVMLWDILLICKFLLLFFRYHGIYFEEGSSWANFWGDKEVQIGYMELIIIQSSPWLKKQILSLWTGMVDSRFSIISGSNCQTKKPRRI